jgi:hypothetical protein
MRILAGELTKFGFKVTTRWLQSTTPFRDLSDSIKRTYDEGRTAAAGRILTVLFDGEPAPTTPVPSVDREAVDFYADCQADIGSSDIVLALTEADGAWQAVLAERLHIPVMTVGPRNQPCFYSENVTMSVEDWERAKVVLSGMAGKWIGHPSPARKLRAFVEES